MPRREFLQLSGLAAIQTVARRSAASQEASQAGRVETRVFGITN
jgi:hypothetical protein